MNQSRNGLDQAVLGLAQAMEGTLVAEACFKMRNNKQAF